MPKRLALLTLLISALAAPAAAHASDVIVQGTTDVRDAGLLNDVIVPAFQNKYPQYTLKYIAVGTGQALTNAEAGQGDAVLTHAPTQEAQFVQGGFSDAPFGRAIFYSDYVIIGPASDPAGVFANAPHDAAHAFELIAAAGQAGTANFVSRGDNSGTNTEEKAIWKLTSGVSLTSSGEPGTGTTNASWYHKANNGQAQTVQLATQCPFTGGGCYDITDRGTFNNLVSHNAISGMKIVADKNDPSARGGMNLLVNSFHAYAVSPQKFPNANHAGAVAFLNFLTSKEFQARLATYPTAAQPAFFADARPTLTLSSKLPKKSYVAGTKVKVAGTIAHNLPGSAPLDGPLLALQTSHVGSIFKAAAGPPAANVLGHNTIKGGKFSFSVPATRSGPLQLSFPQSFDLSATTWSLGKIKVTAKVTLSKASFKGGKVRLSGRALPSTQRDRSAELVVYAHKGAKGKFRKIKAVRAKNHRSRFVLRFSLGSGQWKVRVQYRDHVVVSPGTSHARSVSVP
jgi:tungstate transport system substrate-binding protein